MDDINNIVVMGARNEITANLISVLALSGNKHKSVSIRLEDTIGEPQEVWETLRRKHLDQTYVLVLSNGAFWIHAGLAEELVKWVSEGAHSLIVSLPDSIDPEQAISIYSQHAQDHNVANRVTVLTSPKGIPNPIRQMRGALQALLANGWDRHSGYLYA